MAAYAAFLRGINLGRRRISGGELCEAFTALGLEDVRAFRASGNVAFTARRARPAQLAARIEEGLEETLGYSVPTFLRSAEEVRAIAVHEPFETSLLQASGGKLQVDLLRSSPDGRARDAVLALADEEDRLTFGERELYWLPSGGLLESALDLAAIERLLGPSTRRTKGTIEQFAGKHFPP